MDHVECFEIIFESIPDYRKTVLLMFLIKNDVDILHECGFLENDFTHLCKEFEKTLIEQNEQNTDFIETEEESVIEEILMNKYLEKKFSTLFQDVRHE